MHRIALVALLLLVPAAAAQDTEDACTEAEPCEWIVELDAGGFSSTALDGASFNGTLGDWYRFSILNADDAPHRLTWDGYGQSWDIPAADVLDTQPFELDLEGDFWLIDDPTGDAVPIQVFLGDVVDQEQGAQGDGMDGPEVSQPGPGAVFVGLGLLGLVALRRR